MTERPNTISIQPLGNKTDVIKKEPRGFPDR